MPISNAHHQTDFGAALLDPDLPVPQGIIGPNGKTANKRFNIYRNNVIVSLITALTDIFPAIERLLGHNTFRDLARIYIVKNPPRSALLCDYGKDFATFLEQFEPVSHLPYLPDIARLERAWLDAFHAADAEPLPPQTLGAIPPQQLSEVRFTPHPAAQVLKSKFAAITIFTANRENLPVDHIRPMEPEEALITRPKSEVQIRHLPPGGADFFKAMMEGNTLGEAATFTMDMHPNFNLPSAIGAMLEAGLFSSCHPPKQSGHRP